MCRNIRTLANFAPPATETEIRASSLQFVRKISAANKPSKANEALFERAVDEVAAAAERLIRGWVTGAPPKDRDVEIRQRHGAQLSHSGNSSGGGTFTSVTRLR